MRKFYLYIICTMIVSYFDVKYNLKSIFLFTFFVLSLPFFNDVKNHFKISILKINKIFVIYVLIFSLSFTIFFSLMPYLTFRDYSINKIEDFTNYGILKVFLLSPILEELIFRESLLSLLVKTESPKKAIFLSSLGFSLAHYLSDSSLFTVFILGVFLAYVYLKAQSVVLCIILHSLNNFLALIFPYFLILLLNVKETSFNLLTILIMSGIIMLFSLFKIHKQNLNF